MALTIEAPKQTADVQATAPGKRWSFVWRPPSGAGCPRRGFPLERYRRSMRRIRTPRIGAVALLLALSVLLVDRYTKIRRRLVVLCRVLGAAGTLTFLVGGIGLVVGGRQEASVVS